MPTVEMPQLGESVTEGTILKWLKQPGDPVGLDDPLCEIETEKVTAELPSPFEGVFAEILVPEGETVGVGTPICTIDEAGIARGPGREPTPEPAAAPAGKAPEQQRRFQPDGARAARVRSSPEDRERFYSPVVKRLALEHDIDLAAIQGSGIGGRVTRRDVEAYLEREREAQAPVAPRPGGRPAAPVPTAGGYDVVTFSPTRRTIARRMSRSMAEAPQAWTMVEVDVTALIRRRDADRAAPATGELHLTLLPYFARAVCASLRAHPGLNARWEGDELRRYHAINLGIAVATGAGLVVPVIRDAHDLSIEGLAKAIADLAERARSRQLRVEDVEAGTFTVNNTGTFGSIASKPIVNYPEVAIVTLERAVPRPVVVEGDAIAVRSIANVCLSFDHRALDGHEAGAFLADLKERLESVSI
ncbi:MAG: branched-chain alpha-keto dehydrogenase complex dihydrolipoyllysine-residue (2-methylpropanoyl)transferase [Dehalococcoidia bacterium]